MLDTSIMLGLGMMNSSDNGYKLTIVGNPAALGRMFGIGNGMLVIFLYPFLIHIQPHSAFVHALTVEG